jgi:glycosyltransferase involved in cell wall biosynthesis
MNVIGIDATNIRAGGGLVHLLELLKHANPERDGFSSVVIWANKETLYSIDEQSWIVKKQCKFARNFFSRILWQWLCLGKLIKQENCSILFSPGGSVLSSFEPTVTMSQNLLPFEWDEIKRYSLSIFSFKLILLRLIQLHTFKKSSGVIYLTQYAKNIVTSKMNDAKGMSDIISHGIDKRFFRKPKEQKSISTYSVNNPFKIIYVSPLEPYKHHVNVIRAVSRLKKMGIPIFLELYGPASREFVNKALVSELQEYDPKSEFMRYYGNIDHSEIQEKYFSADAAIFASSCETFGQTLIEGLASGLPTACSEISAMKELLGNNGTYFNPLDPDDISKTLEAMINSVDIRMGYAQGGYSQAKKYSWERCAVETFFFIKQVAKNKRE